MPRTTALLAASVIAAGLLSAPVFGAEDMSTETIENGYRVNAALSQFHRWYLFYEEPAYGIENQLDILTQDVTVKSGLGEATGHEQYAERVAQLSTTWQNAHNPHKIDVVIGNDGTITLTADITYLNQGMMENGGITSAELTYTTTLVPAEAVLPKFSSVEVARNSIGTGDAFVSQYGNNRMRSLVHYWLALIEDPARDPEPVREILANDFSLNFSSGAITDFDGFKAWLAGPGSSVVASTHKLDEFSQTLAGENEYQVTMTFDWNGILPDNTELTAKTKHTWSVTDDPTERFARIKTVDVEVLEPFAPKG